jgi:hypothetical protein
MQRHGMINHGMAIIGIAILAFLSIASGATTPAVQSNQSDPRQQAQKLILGTGISGRGGHWYKIQTTNAGILVVQRFVIIRGNNIAPTLEVYDETRSIARDGGHGRLEIPVVANRAYYVSFSQWDGPYRIIAYYQDQEEETIRKDRLAQAQELSFGIEVSKNIGALEEHWFSFQAAETGNVIVYTSKLATHLQSSGSNNRQISSDDGFYAPEGFTAQLVTSVEAGNTYLLRLIGADSSEKGTYSIMVLTEAVVVAAEAERIQRELQTPNSPSDFDIIQNAQGGITITGYREGRRDVVVIPQTISGIRVTGIGEGAFAQRGLKAVVIPNTVTTIGRSAFARNQLTAFTIPNSVTSIGSAAFESNRLTAFTIPNNITSIGRSAFESNQLTTVTIPNSVTFIDRGAFSNNPVTTLIIPLSLAKSGKDVGFQDTFSRNNPSLASITLPANVDDRNLTSNFDQGFVNFYISQNKRAGTYTKENGIWKLTTPR